MQLTVDLEDHTPPNAPSRLGIAVGPLLDAFAESAVTATFFVLGETAEQQPEIVDRIRQSGHEIGLHGYRHRLLRDLGPAGLTEDLRRGRDVLEKLGCEAIVGYRAPYFSVTAEVPWAPEVIAGEGFLYSSSVLPAWNPQAGYPGAPRTPFRWPCGLLELPATILGLGRFGVPLGGLYLRLLPELVIRRVSRRGSNRTASWAYAHPYDFDPTEPKHVRPDQNSFTTWLLWLRRDRMLSRFLQLHDTDSQTLRAVASDEKLVATLPVWAEPHPQTRLRP